MLTQPHKRHSLVTVLYPLGGAFVIVQLPERVTAGLQQLIVAVM